MEILVNPKESFTTIVNFDGRVLELFYGESDDGAKRFHISHITSVSFGPDKKGRHNLEFKTRSGEPFLMEVDPAKVAEVQSLVDAVKNAMGSSK